MKHSRPADGRRNASNCLAHLLVVVVVMLLSTASLAAAQTTSGAQSTLSTPPTNPTNVGTVAGTARAVDIQARDVGGVAQTSGGDVFVVTLYTSSPSCDTANDVACRPSCSPFHSPHTASCKF
jgi:hypothetical protein